MEMTINEMNKYIFSHFSSDADVISFGDDQIRGVPRNFKLAFYFHFMHQSRNSPARYSHWKMRGWIDHTIYLLLQRCSTFSLINMYWTLVYLEETLRFTKDAITRINFLVVYLLCILYMYGRDFVTVCSKSIYKYNLCISSMYLKMPDGVPAVNLHSRSSFVAIVDGWNNKINSSSR